MRGMVLAAGFGTRLRPLTNLLPKPLVPVLNRPLITYLLDLLKKAGVSEVAINQHHHAQKIPEALGDGSAF
ncbi:MAG: NDP-sugar synthase, partial [Deltaproteobacteria bacterium]|nr:NDP-sugar synthase [Deltaproteobacteria bacterium]